MKIPACDRCQFYTHNPFLLVCAVHPSGVDTSSCPDFKEDPKKTEDIEQWAPQGYCYYAGELIPNRPPRLTREQQW